MDIIEYNLIVDNFIHYSFNSLFTFFISLSHITDTLNIYLIILEHKWNDAIRWKCFDKFDWLIIK